MVESTYFQAPPGFGGMKPKAHRSGWAFELFCGRVSPIAAGQASAPEQRGAKYDRPGQGGSTGID